MVAVIRLPSLGAGRAARRGGRSAKPTASRKADRPGGTVHGNANLMSHRARKQQQTVVLRPMADHGLTRLADVTLCLKPENVFHQGCDPSQIAHLPAPGKGSSMGCPYSPNQLRKPPSWPGLDRGRPMPPPHLDPSPEHRCNCGLESPSRPKPSRHRMKSASVREIWPDRRISPSARPSPFTSITTRVTLVCGTY